MSMDVFEFNDKRTTAEVLAAFDTAIAYAEAAEQEFSPSACEPVPGLVTARYVNGHLERTR
jgi:hypothetical protein